MKFFKILGIASLLLALTSPVWSGEKSNKDSYTFYDKSWKVKGYYRNGTVYDKGWKTKGYVRDNSVYDKSWKVKGYLKNGNNGRGSGRSK